MKNFLIKLSLFIALILGTIYIIFTRVNGYSDSYYLRFTTPKQSSLILGVSKSAQSLQPQVFNEVLNRKDFFNYSFNIHISPYGKTYLESIKRKLNTNTKDGVFILTFDAWSLGSQTDDPNDSTNFRENDLCLKNYFVNMNPNIPYLLSYYEYKYIDIFKRTRKNIKLHENGWLEVNVPMDSIALAERLNTGVKHYNEKYMPFWKTSELRINYLVKTAKYLNNFGDVYLVRLPVHDRLLELENKITPDLDSIVFKISKELNVEYLNYSDSSNNYIYTDGIHLFKDSGKEVSRSIAHFIKNKNNDKFSEIISK